MKKKTTTTTSRITPAAADDDDDVCIRGAKRLRRLQALLGGVQYWRGTLLSGWRGV